MPSEPDTPRSTAAAPVAAPDLRTTRDAVAMPVVFDEAHPCPYLPEQQARMPLRWPGRAITPEMLDRLLETGYRRTGPFFYRTECPHCVACQPVRLDVHRLRIGRSLRRVLAHGQRSLTVTLERSRVDAARLRLFNRHRSERGLAIRDEQVDVEEYASFLVDTCCDTRDLVIRSGDTLLAVATTDFGSRSLSAVYCYFAPDWRQTSLGTYAILKQVELAQKTGRQFVYLGMYVAANAHLRYKARFVPQQRRVGGQWQSFETPES